MFLSFENTYCQQKNIIIYKVRHTVAEDRIGIFINCFLCVYKFQKHVLWTKTLYRVQKLVTLLQGQTSAILLDCTIGVYEFKNMFRKQKTIIVDKIRHIVAEVRISIFINCFLCFIGSPNTFFGQKTLYRVQKLVTLLCASLYDERRSLEKDVAVMQLLIPFSQTSAKKNCNFDLCPCVCNTHGVAFVPICGRCNRALHLPNEFTN